MGIELHYDQLVTRGGVRLLALPKWAIPSKPGRYWHIPRTAELRGSGLGVGDVCVHFWCDQVSVKHKIGMFTDEEPDEMQCGTCVGRWQGARGAGQLIFRPRSSFDLPKKCPARCGAAKLCPFCGSPPRARYRRYYADEAPHPTGELLALYEPCPRHGWKYLAMMHDGTLQCRCFVGAEGTCGFTIHQEERHGDD